MKKRIIALSFIGLVVLSAFLYFVAIPRISVSGTGTVTTYPDEADLQFSVQTQNQSAVNAAAANGVIMTRVYAALFALGVNKSEIQTTSYSLSAVYDSVNSSKLVGYAVVNSVQITITGTENLPIVGEITDAVVKAGVNQVDGISFTFTDSNYNDLQNEAYQKAVHDAYSQASAIVSVFGGVIIGVESVSTNYVFPPTPQPIVYSGTVQTKLPTPITPGPQQVTSTVYITYLYI